MNFFHTAPARTGAGMKEISNIYQAGHFVTVNHENRRNFPNGTNFAPARWVRLVAHRVAQGPRHGAVAFSDLRRVGWLLSLAHGAGGVVLPAFSLGIVMDGGARSGHLVGLAAEG